MPLERILKLGHPLLYEKANEVAKNELVDLAGVIDELHNLVEEFRTIYGFGRAIAAPQRGVMKRIICYNHGTKVTIINPVLYDMSEEMMELWDDCMSFPKLYVRLKRHRSCKMDYYDEYWQKHTWELKDDLSELMQHEYDHLNGILATMRAIDHQSFRMID